MSLPVFKEALVKLAARCNLNCTYCYWFRDQSVYNKPPILTSEAQKAFLARLEQHIQQHNLRHFSLILHGGEPLLFGKSRFVGLMDAINGIESRTGCAIARSLTTNGALVDQEWAQLFRLFNVQVTVSIDGPASIHDRARIDFKGRGTYEQVMRGVERLRKQGLEPGVLAVCDPASDPAVTARHFAEALGFTTFDILVPDATHDDMPPSIASYYSQLFDLWYDNYLQREISIRFLQTLVDGLVESITAPATVGYNPIETFTVLTDGALEAVDVLRIAGNGSTSTGLSVLTHTFQDLTTDPLWSEAFLATQHLPAICQECEYCSACSGGYLPHRWSKQLRFNNPSVYCSDLKALYKHIWERIAPDLQVTTAQHGQISLLELLTSQTGGAGYGLG